MRQVDEVTTRLEEEIAALYYEHSWRKKPEAPSVTPGSAQEVGELEAVTMTRDPQVTEEAR